MFNSSDNVSRANTQIHSGLCGSSTGSISPAITSYSNGGSTTILKNNSLFQMENSNMQVSKFI